MVSIIYIWEIYGCFAYGVYNLYLGNIASEYITIIM